MNLLEVNIDKNHEYTSNSNIIKIINNKKYEFVTEVIGFAGKPYSAYFGIVFLDENGLERDRKISWLNDFSGKKKEIRIIAQASSDKLLFIYRINTETPYKSDSKFSLLPFDIIKINESLLTDQVNFDNIINYSLPKPQELTNEEENILERNLVWLFGSPRSGTSWLGLQLLSFQTHSINEPHIDDHLGAERSGLTDNFVRWIDRRKWDPSYFFSDAHKETWQYYLRKLILYRIYSQVHDIYKKIIIKSPGSFGAADIILDCLPKSNMILLLRDGRDVVDSLLDARGHHGFMAKNGAPEIYKNQRFSFIEYRSKIWIELMKNLKKGYEHHPFNLRYKIRYEDLRRNTLEELRKIYKFLEIDIPERELQKIVEKYTFENLPDNIKGSGKFHRSATAGKWKENFTEKEIELINKIMGNTLKELGYF